MFIKMDLLGHKEKLESNTDNTSSALLTTMLEIGNKSSPLEKTFKCTYFSIIFPQWRWKKQDGLDPWRHPIKGSIQTPKILACGAEI